MWIFFNVKDEGGYMLTCRKEKQWKIEDCCEGSPVADCSLTGHFTVSCFNHCKNVNEAHNGGIILSGLYYTVSPVSSGDVQIILQQWDDAAS